MKIRFAILATVVGLAFTGCESLPSSSAASPIPKAVPQVDSTPDKPASILRGVKVTLDLASADNPRVLTKRFIRQGNNAWLRPDMALKIISDDGKDLTDVKFILSPVPYTVDGSRPLPDTILNMIHRNDGYRLGYSDLANKGLIAHGKVLTVTSEEAGLSLEIRLFEPVSFLSAVKYPILYVFNGKADSFELQNFSPSLSVELIKWVIPIEKFGYFSIDGMGSITPSAIETGNYSLAVGGYFDLAGWAQLGFLADRFDKVSPKWIFGVRPDSLVANIVKSSTDSK